MTRLVDFLNVIFCLILDILAAQCIFSIILVKLCFCILRDLYFVFVCFDFVFVCLRLCLLCCCGFLKCISNLKCRNAMQKYGIISKSAWERKKLQCVIIVRKINSKILNQRTAVVENL